jgi:hypothetical protein
MKYLLQKHSRDQLQGDKELICILTKFPSSLMPTYLMEKPLQCIKLFENKLTMNKVHLFIHIFFFK